MDGYRSCLMLLWHGASGLVHRDPFLLLFSMYYGNASVQP